MRTATSSRFTRYARVLRPWAVSFALLAAFSALLARQMTAAARRLPFVTTLHGTDITLVGADRSYFGITRFSIEASDGVTSISEYLRRRTVEVFGVGNEIRVIPNFVNCDQYRPNPEARAASALGISRVTLYKKMKKYKLDVAKSSPIVPLANQPARLPGGVN